MMLVDLQGSMYKLFPEIATSILQEEEGGETNFCAGNLTIHNINIHARAPMQHILCNVGIK